jgi:hypothetical protein
VLEAIKRIHVLKLKQKDFEKTLLTLHYSRMVKPADLQKEIKVWFENLTEEYGSDLSEISFIK